MAVKKKLSFGRRRIIKRKTLFQRVYSQGKSYSGRYFFLRVLKRGPESAGVNKSASLLIEYSRLETLFAVAAGKKLGGAVVRNRVKRRLREALRLRQLTLKSGFYLLLIGRRAAVSAPLSEILRELDYFCRKAGLTIKAEQPPQL